MIITIDGPAGTGKTTIARKVAERLNYQYFDTGAMYRAATYLILEKKIDLQDAEALKCFLADFDFTIKEESNGKHYYVAGTDVTDLIRSQRVTNMVSLVAAHPEMRKKMSEIQRSFGLSKNAVFEGRDMGTVIFPEAQVKIFLTARPEVRAERRYLELKGKKIITSEEKVLQELASRDHSDTTRELSPLKAAPDAHVIDTSDLTIEEVIELILPLIPEDKS